MTWSYFTALIPSMFMHWIATVALCLVVWWYTRETLAVKIKWVAVVVFATALSLFHALNVVVQISQNGALSQRQQELATKAQQAMATAGNNPNLKIGTEEEVRVRQEFLKMVEQLVGNPNQVTPEVRQQVISSFQGIFGNQQLSQLYKQNIANFFLCGKAYMVDAIKSVEQKKEIKSADQATCAALTGEFFGRQKLIPDEFAKPYVETITMVSRGRMPAAKVFPGGVDDIKRNLQRQDTALQVLAFLFQ